MVVLLLLLLLLGACTSGTGTFSPFGCVSCLQVKIMTEKELLAVACEQFLGKNVQDVKNVVLQTLEGHLRSILGMEGLVPCSHLRWLCPFSAGPSSITATTQPQGTFLCCLQRWHLPSSSSLCLAGPCDK